MSERIKREIDHATIIHFSAVFLWVFGAFSFIFSLTGLMTPLRFLGVILLSMLSSIAYFVLSERISRMLQSLVYGNHAAQHHLLSWMISGLHHSMRTVGSHFWRSLRTGMDVNHLSLYRNCL